MQNPGIDKVIAEELPHLRKIFHNPIVANISGFSLEEYEECCAKIDKEEQVEIIEVNVSCPNVHNGGMSFGTQPESAAEVTRRVKAVTKKPVFIKLSPNVTDIVAIARACEEAGADGICLINTLWVCASTPFAVSPLLPIRWAVFRVMPSSPLPFVWSTRWLTPARFPLWAAVA